MGIGLASMVTGLGCLPSVANGTSIVQDSPAPEQPQQVLTGGLAISQRGLAGRGALGIIVHDRDTGAPMILTNTHVLAGSKVEAPAVGAQIEVVPDPGMPEIGVVATITRFGINNSANNSLNDDFGVATLAPTARYRARYDAGIRGMPVPGGVGEPVKDHIIRYYDLLTGVVAKCPITDVSGAVQGTPSNHFALGKRADGQDCAKFGDSGSVVVDDATNLAVGLIKGGAINGSTFAIRLSYVLDTLRVDYYDPATKSAPVFSYHNPSSDSSFFTLDWSELGAGEPRTAGGDTWSLLNKTGSLFRGQVPSSVPVHRYYNASINDHFYTIDPDEAQRTGALAAGWVPEGIAGYAFDSPRPGTVPLYRYHRANSVHLLSFSLEPGGGYISDTAGPNPSSSPIAFYVYPDPGTDPPTP